MTSHAESAATAHPAISSDLTAMQTCRCRDVLGDHEDHGACKRQTCDCPEFVRVYSTAELAALAGATYRMIDHWTRAGYIADPRPANELGPSRQPDAWHHGSGHPRWWTHDELELVRLVAALVNFGVMPARAFEVANELLAADLYSLTLGDIWQLTITPTPLDPSPEEDTP